jgi:hypothetical protein
MVLRTVEKMEKMFCEARTENFSSDEVSPSSHDAEDLTELVEHVWKLPRVRCSPRFGVRTPQEGGYEMKSLKLFSPEAKLPRVSTLGVQGARLGMDMALEMIAGVRQLGRIPDLVSEDIHLRLRWPL